MWVTTQDLPKVRTEELTIVVIAQRFCKEVVTCQSLRHPNVLPLLGVTMEKKVFAMVSEWMVNGNITEFVKAHRDANRFELLESYSHHLPHPSLMITPDSSRASPGDCYICTARE